MADIWRYGGREFELDFFDVDDLDRLLTAVRDLKEGLEIAGDEKKAAELLVSRFFSDVLGESPAKLILSGTEADRADVMMNACACFTEFVTERCRAAEENIGKWEQKYLLPVPEVSER